MLKQLLKTLEGLDPSFHSLYEEQEDGTFKLTGVEGMSYASDVAKLTTSLTAERAAHKATKQKFAPILSSGMELDDIVSLIDRREELEAGNNQDINSRVETLVASKLKQATAPLERKLAETQAALGEREEELTTFRTRDRSRTIGDAIRQAADKSQGFHKHAIEDALLLGSSLLDITEEGTIVVKETGLGVDSWLSDMQKSRPHWWEGSAGGGAAGNNGGGSGGGNPFTKAHWSLEAQGALIRSDKARAEQMAKAAGVSFGATAPVK